MHLTKYPAMGQAVYCFNLDGELQRLGYILVAAPTGARLVALCPECVRRLEAGGAANIVWRWVVWAEYFDGPWWVCEHIPCRPVEWVSAILAGHWPCHSFWPEEIAHRTELRVKVRG